jgi:two-component sensor histidine kinase
MSLQFRLSVLVAIAVSPPLLLTAYNTARWQNFFENEARGEALDAARLVNAEFNRIIEGSRQLMLALSKHPAVPDREDECTAYFKAVIAELPIYREAAVIDKDGKFHCSTIPIPPTLNVSDRVYFREPMETGRLTVGTLVQGRVTHTTSLHISMPYRSPQGSFEGVIVLILNPERLAQDLAARPFPPHQRVMVLDREGALILTLPPEGTDVAKRLASEVFERVGNTPAGTVQVGAALGRSDIVGYVPASEEPRGLFIAVGIDREFALSPVKEANQRSVLFAFVTLALAVFGTWIAIHLLIRRPVMALVRTARRREAGDMEAQFPPLRPGTELGALSAALSAMSGKINELLEQKNFLMRELQHRVMNSLQMLASLLALQDRHVADPAAREQLTRARERILSVGTVYRYLYQADVADSVEVSSFLRTICDETQRAYVGTLRPTIDVDVDPLRVNGTHAIALAVLTHELITNAIKHAYPGGVSGKIAVSLKRNAEGGFDFRFTDRGRGLPEDFQLEQSTSLGLKVISATARQLGGSVEIVRLDPGTEFVVHLPASIAESDLPAAAE